MNPLRTVAELCRILLETVNPNEARLIKAILSGVKFMQFTVNNILNFARVQRNADRAVNEEFFDFSKLLQTVTEFLQEVANMKKIFIDIVCLLSAEIKADRRKI